MQNIEDSATPPASDLALFIQTLVNEGRPVISAQASRVDDSDVLPLLKQMDEFAREELALELPAFSPATAHWAARLFYHLCRPVLCREIPAEEIKARSGIPCPEQRSPETDWSADLTLRHLSRLLTLANQLSNADPLVEQIKQIAAAWPLSSVGIAGLGELQLSSFIDHPALRRLYADRIISAGDTTRLGDLRVNDWLRADLGVHHQLAPAIAKKLFEPSHEPQ